MSDDGEVRVRLSFFLPVACLCFQIYEWCGFAFWHALASFFGIIKPECRTGGERWERMNVCVRVCACVCEGERERLPFLSWLPCLLLGRHHIAHFPLLISLMGRETSCTLISVNLISAAGLFTVTRRLLSVTNTSCGPGECHYSRRTVI